MRYIINLLLIAVIAVSGAFVFSSEVFAQRSCTVMTSVETIPESDTEFPYTVSGDVTSEFTLTPESKLYDGIVNLLPGETATVTQGAVEGWVLRDIVCFNNIQMGNEADEVATKNLLDGLIYSVSGSGVTLTCEEATFASCTFINSQPQNIPTISEWGIISMVLAFGVVGFFVLRRRQAA